MRDDDDKPWYWAPAHPIEIVLLFAFIILIFTVIVMGKA